MKRTGEGRVYVRADPQLRPASLAWEDPWRDGDTCSCLPSRPPGAPLAGGRSLGSPYKHKEDGCLLGPVPRVQFAVSLRGSHLPSALQIQAGQRTHPPSTISSTAKKRPSMFSSKARFSTFFLNPQKKIKIRLCEKGILGHCK